MGDNRNNVRRHCAECGDGRGAGGRAASPKLALCMEPADETARRESRAGTGSRALPECRKDKAA